MRTTKATRLPRVTDPTANGVRDPIHAEVTMHDPNGREYVIEVIVGYTYNIVPAAERAIENLQMDLGVTDWRGLP